MKKIFLFPQHGWMMTKDMLISKKQQNLLKQLQNVSLIHTNTNSVREIENNKIDKYR